MIPFFFVERKRLRNSWNVHDVFCWHTSLLTTLHKYIIYDRIACQWFLDFVDIFLGKYTLIKHNSHQLEIIVCEASFL
jgi:hypothetical protein